MPNECTNSDQSPLMTTKAPSSKGWPAMGDLPSSPSPKGSPVCRHDGHSPVAMQLKLHIKNCQA
eukprot:16442514-Heterocapsa_arctica.AAC.1